MRYMLLIYGNEIAAQGMTEEEMQAEYQGYEAFGEEATKRGFDPNGHALQSVTTATTVRVRDGKPLVTDGPFAETKEQLGGYYILNCKDLDEAIAAATKIPGVRSGSIEIRPVMEFGD